MQGDIFQIDKEPLLEIPIFLTTNQTHHNQLVTLVEQMLATKKQLQTETLEKNINYLTNKCTSIDAQIDALVYTLYGLTAEEISIVEGG